MRSEHFRLLVGKEFPFPIALAFRQAGDEKASREAACLLFHETMEFVGHVLLCDYLAQEGRDDALDTELSRILREPPVLGVWADWISRILLFFESRGRAPILEESTAFREKSVQQDVAKLLHWRNSWAHGTGRFDVGAFRAKLFDLLERLILIHRYTLLLPKEVHTSRGLHTIQAYLLNGDNPIFGQIECRSDIPLEDGQTYFYARESRQLICLHPFVTCTACPTCGELHYFKFNRCGHRKLLSSSIPAGHELQSPDAYTHLEHLFRQRKNGRISPRHFSLPGAFAGLPRTLKPGDLVGAYRVEDLIKIGGMGQIYRVADTRTGKSHALKLLPLELARDPVLLTRFEGEAASLQRLSHPNIVVLHDLGESLGDRYLILELAEGRAFGGSRHRDVSEIPKPVSESLILEIAMQVCEGLSYVHSQGIYHRDLKPSNLLLSGDRVILTDFGVSMIRGEERHTLTGMPVGTPEYMAPEQVIGGDLDERTDIYALGCVLYELATGRPPYRADTPLTTALYHLQTRPPRIEDLNPKLSAGLVHIIYKALQKKPEHRYPTARKLFDELARVQEDPAGPQLLEGDQAPQDILEEIRARERRRYRRRVRLLLVLLPLVLLAGFAGRQLRNELRIRSLVSQASVAWEAGAGSLESCCEALRAAYVIDPGHGAVNALRGKVYSQGRLRIRSEPPAAAVEVRPDPDQDGRAGFKPPRGSTAAAAKGFAGETLWLSPGHYQVKVEAGGSHREFPVFLGHVLHTRTAEGRWEPRMLQATDEVDPGSAGEEDSLVLAAEVEIGTVDLRGEVPQGLRYIPPGDFFCSRLESLETSLDGQKGPKADGITLPILARKTVRIPMDRGFFIGECEVTVREFEAWWRTFGKPCCEWFAESGVESWLYLLGDGVTVDVLRRTWSSEEDFQGKDMAAFDSVRKLVEERHRGYFEVWAEHVAKMDAKLAEQKEKHAPVVWVMWSIAVCYARTHFPVVTREFLPWLDLRIAEASGIVLALRTLREGLAAGPSLIERKAVPDDLLLPRKGNYHSSIGGPPVGLVEAYSQWIHDGLRSGLRFAGDVPGSQVVDAARRRGEGGMADFLAISSELVGDPLRRIGGRPEHEQLIMHWMDDVSAGKEALERDSFLKWLLHVEDTWGRQQKLLEELRQRFGGLDPAATLPTDEIIPWTVRLEFGFDMGWGLPVPEQWEKACRSDDGRVFPWGKEAASHMHSWFVQEAPLPAKLMGWPRDQDMSPYGVRAMGSNVSEWVAYASNEWCFAKGGAYPFSGTYADARRFYGIDQGRPTTWIGLRVVKAPR